jgi:hypothetical protein
MAFQLPAGGSGLYQAGVGAQDQIIPGNFQCGNGHIVQAVRNPAGLPVSFSHFHPSLR